MKQPSPRERDLLGFIDRFEKSKGFAPTLYEMAEGLDVSKTRVAQLVGELVAKELVERIALAHRSLRLTAAGAAALRKKAA